MGWFTSQEERHPEFARYFSEEREREKAAFYATVDRLPCYHYEKAAVNAAAHSRAKERVRQLRGFNDK